MMRYLVFLLICAFSTITSAQSNWLSFSAGLQAYDQLGNFNEFSLGVSNDNPNLTILGQSTATGIRPIVGLQYQNILPNQRIFKLNFQYATSEYDFNTVLFERDQAGNIMSGDFSPSLGQTRTHFVQVAADYGFPLLKNGENWQFYAAGRVGIQYEAYFQNTDLTTVFPRDETFVGTSAALSPELAYTFPNEKIQISFNPVIQFFRIGLNEVQLGDPTLSQEQSRIEEVSLELFGNQPINFDLRVAFAL